MSGVEKKEDWDKEEFDGCLKCFTSLPNPELLTARYDEYDTYEEKSIEINYNAPTKLVELGVCKYVIDLTSSFLDVGAGTGLVASELRKNGYTGVIDGLDPSTGLAKIAKEKNIYRNYHVEYLTEEPTTLPPETYDNIVSAGAFLQGHIKYKAINELIRLVKPGGRILICFRKDYFEMEDLLGIEPFLAELVDNKTCEVERFDFPDYYFGYSGHILVMKKL